MIERNRHAAGRISNMAFGAATVIDGFVRVLSLGYLHTRLPLNVAKWQTRAVIRRLKARAASQ
ncbi:hypothetical protein [Cupriavidus sp. CP313]